MKLYIDESGSMTVEYCQSRPYFVIAIAKIKNPELAKRRLKRFVSKNLTKLKNLDANENKMFYPDGKFKELKGSSLDYELKREFLNKMLVDDCIELYYIVLNNSKIDGNFYGNTARAFNYCVKNALSYFIRKGFMESDISEIHIDERNESTHTAHFLQEYLNIELFLHEKLIPNNVVVRYFDSANHSCIQIADVFCNIKYSDLLTGNYSDLLKIATKQGNIRKIFIFPPKS